MSADKHPAEVLASCVLIYGCDDEQNRVDVAKSLRRIPALEAERDRYKTHIEAQSVELDKLIPMAEALEAERDHLRTEVMEQARLLGMSGERELALRAEIDRLRKDADALREDAERMDWLCFVPALTVSANMPYMREWLIERPAVLNNLRDAIDAARKMK